MAKKSIMIMNGLALLISFSWAAANPWSNLKKIYFFDSSGDISAVKENLTQLEAQNLIPAEKIELLQKLNELGDRYYQKKKLSLGRGVLSKNLDHFSPGRLANIQQTGKNQQIERKSALEFRQHRAAVMAAQPRF